MGNNISGILAIVFMARMESQTIDNLSIGLYKRYVDDVIILTNNREEADHISKIMNRINKCIQFETEYPNQSNAAAANISLIDLRLTIDKEGNSSFRFYRKPGKKNTFPNATSALPLQAKKPIITNELERISLRCTANEEKKRHKATFLNDLSSRGYKTTTTRRRRQKMVTAKPVDLSLIHI